MADLAEPVYVVRDDVCMPRIDRDALLMFSVAAAEHNEGSARVPAD
jgi:hypothetical protein